MANEITIWEPAKLNNGSSLSFRNWGKGPVGRVVRSHLPSTHHSHVLAILGEVVAESPALVASIASRWLMAKIFWTGVIMVQWK